jgi:hypothetical protein
MSEEGIAAVMVDGYALDCEEFEALRWQGMIKQGRLQYRDWLEHIRRYQREIKSRYNESTYLTAYRNAIAALMRTSLLANTKTYNANDPPESIGLYHGFTSGHTRGSIESSSPSCLITPSVRNGKLPVLQTEYRHDESKGRLHYIQNVFVYPHSSNTRFSNIGELCDNWIDALQFQEKLDEEYVSLRGFASAWSAILADMTCIHDDCPFYWRLYDHMGLDY